MSTIQQKPADNKKSPALPIAIVAAIAFLAVAGYFYWQTTQLSNKLTVTTEKLDESEILKSEVQKQYYESLTELEEMRGSNAELNTLIDAQKAELEESKTRIDGLLRDKRNLGAARTELKKLKEQADGYVLEIQQLREENGLLTEQNLNLSTENEGLQRTVADATAANEELSAARAALMSEKEVLATERDELAGTVTMASVVKVNEVDVTGLRMKDNGKSVRKKYAKNVDLLNICFETDANEITTPGTEEFYVRIINPLGETLAVEEMGSGILTNTLTKEQVRYTKLAQHQYQNDVSEVCITWDAPTQLAKGDYGVEVYNKGYLSGQGSFRLK